MSRSSRRQVSSPHVLLAPAYGDVGGGHVLRCLALASALADLGARATFAAPPAAAAVLDRFAERPFGFHGIADEADLPEACRRLDPDAVVIDNYAAAAPEERALRNGDRVLMAIDDLADRPHDVDLLLDAGYGRRAEDYAGLTPRGAELLIGTAYALLRPAFAAARARPAEVRQDLRRVFLSFGLSDVGGVTARAVEAIRPLAPDAELDIAVGQDAASLPELRVLADRDRKVRLHVETLDVAELMQGADLAVGGGGGATWERCCLGLPSIAVIVAENQRPAISALATDGVLLAVDMAQPDWERALEAAVERLRPPAVRRELRARALAICDGRGAERAAAALLARLESAS